MDSMFSTEKRIMVPIPKESRVLAVDLDLTVQYDGSFYNLLLRGGIVDSVPVLLPLHSNHPLSVMTFATAHATAAELVAGIGLPKDSVDIIRDVLGKHFGPRLQMWIADTQQRICAPETPAATVAAAPEPQTAQALVTVNGDTLVSVDRDLSGIFGQREGSCLLEYTLFSEPKIFRCLLACHRNGEVKLVDLQKKSVTEIIGILNSDNLAFEIAMYFGDTASSRVHLVSAVLKLSFAMNTGLAMHPVGPTVSAPSPSDQQETETVPCLRPVPRFMVVNGGEQFEVPA